MKRQLLSLCASGALLALGCSVDVPAVAQTTWQVGNTTLTQTDLVSGLELPWEVQWGADDHLWCTSRKGYVYRINPEDGEYTTVLNINSLMPSGGSSEPGLLGMAIHPDWETTPRVFLVYNYSQGNSVRERLVSYEWNGTALVNEDILIDNIPGNFIHNGSRLAISPDNKIMMTTGDTGSGALSQNLNSLNGKVLRINLDGTIPADNPDPESYVWSFGHRNAQGLCYGPNDILYSSEHGQTNSDEFNIIEENRNYGWPNVEGACNTASEITFCEANNVKEPLMEWSPCVAVNGIIYYNHPAIPEWQHSVLMGVMGGLSGTNSDRDRVSVLHLSEDGLTVTSEDKYFTSLNQRFRDVCYNPYDGTVYVALNGTGYPGSGPNKIIQFRNDEYVSVKNHAALSSQLTIYPNPALDSITLDVAEKLVGKKATIYSVDGKRVMDFDIKQTRTSVDIHHLTSGNYWLTIGEGDKLTKSFIVR
jgi:glucose/arabinose dehydrogenase